MKLARDFDFRYLTQIIFFVFCVVLLQTLIGLCLHYFKLSRFTGLFIFFVVIWPMSYLFDVTTVRLRPAKQRTGWRRILGS